MIKETLKEDGNFVIIKLWSNGKTDYRVQENKYGEEWEWDDFKTLEQAEKDFFFKVEVQKTAEIEAQAEIDARAEAQAIPKIAE